MTIRIDPLDTFFFRDGKPFTMGAENWTDTVFPPSPSVFYGALRTCWLSNQLDGFTKENIEKSENLKITGIYIQINDDLYLPVPKDFVTEKKDNSETLLTDQTESLLCNKSEFLKVLTVPNKSIIVEEVENNSLMSLDNIERYLNKKHVDKLSYRKSKDYLCKESKLGISRNFDSRTTDEGMLYRVDFNRFKNDEENKIAFVINFEGLDFPQNGKIRLGGEAKLAEFELTQGETIELNDFNSWDSFKLYLATPTIFKNGWLPSWINSESFISEGFDFQIQLISTSNGKSVSIGGFDLLKGEPKPMYKAVPAGSVYYFKILCGSINDIIKQFHIKNISENYPNQNFSNQGFGLSYIGKI